MRLGHAMMRRARGAIAPSIFLALVAYFVWNVIEGDRGLRAYAQRQQLLRQAQAELAQAEQERDAWERRASGLRNPHIDRDTLDERARAMLNLADPTDIIIPYGPKDRLF